MGLGIARHVGSTYDTDHLGVDYKDMHQFFLSRGQARDSRYGETKELMDFRLELSNPLNCIVDRKGFSHRFMNAEIDQFIAGVHDGEVLKAVSPQAAGMITEKTNYGVRIGSQLANVVDELRDNRNSRRAVAYVGNPDDLEHIRNHPAERVGRANEIACACVWHFLVRDDEVHLFIYGRSWDIVWGLCYDIPSSVAVQMAVAKALGLGLGSYVFHAGSAHLYERHYDLDIATRNKALSLEWLSGENIRTSQVIAYERIVEAKSGDPREFYNYVS